MTAKILAFAGSARLESFNKKLVKIAAECAKAAGAEVTFVDLRDYPIPLYDGDLEDEHGVPENARTLRKLVQAHKGLIIASPEYNGTVTPLLKNTLDWISRPDGELMSKEAYKDKVALVVAASIGAFGGIRGLPMARQLLNHLGVLVIPAQLCLPNASSAFDGRGGLVNPDQHRQLATMVEHLVGLADS